MKAYRSPHFKHHYIFSSDKTDELIHHHGVGDVLLITRYDTPHNVSDNVIDIIELFISNKYDFYVGTVTSLGNKSISSFVSGKKYSVYQIGELDAFCFEIEYVLELSEEEKALLMLSYGNRVKFLFS